MSFSAPLDEIIPARAGLDHLEVELTVSDSERHPTARAAVLAALAPIGASRTASGSIRVSAAGASSITYLAAQARQFDAAGIVGTLDEVNPPRVVHGTLSGIE
jgi:hypothetical protein